nr:hypothetical protein GCM10010200_007270 [Actinomadura rugatobispora]
MLGFAPPGVSETPSVRGPGGPPRGDASHPPRSVPLVPSVPVRAGLGGSGVGLLSPPVPIGMSKIDPASTLAWRERMIPGGVPRILEGLGGT